MIAIIKQSRNYRLPILIISISLACIVSWAEQAETPTKVELPEEAVVKKNMDNGLIILAKEVQDCGLVAIDVKIRAGSSLEGEYLGSGITHFVEHMVFKGTRFRGVGEIERQIRSLGGFINGATSYDQTHYYVTVPRQYLAPALSIIKDMLWNAAFEKGEYEKERDVILAEQRLRQDEPQGEIIRYLYGTSYIAHPYKYPPIGCEERFKALRRDDLIKFYNRMYVPNRIVVAVAGGISAKEIISAVEMEFADFRPANYEIVPVKEEPPQVGKRHLDIEGETNLSYLAMAFHSTSIFDKDLYAMDVLAMVLGRGNNSRLNDILLKKEELVYSISSWNYTPADPGLFVITATLDKKNLDSAERHITDEIRRLKIDTVGDTELENAKRMVVSDYVFSRQTTEAQASDISENELITGNYGFSHIYVKLIQAVTKEDVKRVASAYLSENNLTVVRLMPKAPKEIKLEADLPGKMADSIHKETLPNGARLLLREDKKTPTVSITVVFLGGLAAEDPSISGISNMTANMLLKGTSSRTEDRIRGFIEALGGNIDSFSGFNAFGLNLSLLKPDIDQGLLILKDVISDPSFPETELRKEKEITLAMIREEDNDIFKKGSNTLRKILYGPAPYGMRYLGEPDMVRSLTRKDLVDFYKTYCVPNNMVISVSGDIDSRNIFERLKELFGGMKHKDIPPLGNKIPKMERVRIETLEMDKEQSLLLVGFITEGIRSPDRYALDLLSSILSGYSGRLFTNLRDRLSLAYTLGCNVRFAIDTGYALFYVATTKDKVNRAREALLAQINVIRSRPISANELDLAKREAITNYEISMQTNSFYSSQSALDELYGIGYDNIYKYKDRIEAVTEEDVKSVAQKYFDLDAYAEVVIASKQDSKSFATRAGP